MKRPPSIIPGRLLIIQLARFGDVMQTAPIVKAAVSDGWAAVDLLVEEDLAPLARRIEGVDEVLTVQRHLWFMALAEANGRWSDALPEVRRLAERLRSRNWSRVLNLTHTRESAHIAALAMTPVDGLTADRRGTYTLSAWEAWFQSVHSRRRLNPFHLCDIHLGIGELAPPRSCGKIASRASGSLEKTVAFAIGAGERFRRWPAERYAAAAASIYRLTGARLVILGSKSESELARRLCALTEAPVTDLTGRTRLEDLPETLADINLLVSTDTGTLHLAAAMGLQTLSLFIGGAQPGETAPYDAGHLVILPRVDCHSDCRKDSCAEPLCAKSISPESVAQISAALIRGLPLPDVSAEPFDLLITAFDDAGRLELRRLNGEDNVTERAKLLGGWWLASLRGDVSPNFSSEAFDAPALRALRQAASQAGLALRGRDFARFAQTLTQIEGWSRRRDEVGLAAHLFTLELAAAERRGDVESAFRDVLSRLTVRCDCLVKAVQPKVAGAVG